MISSMMQLLLVALRICRNGKPTHSQCRQSMHHKKHVLKVRLHGWHLRQTNMFSNPRSLDPFAYEAHCKSATLDSALHAVPIAAVACG